MVNTRLLVHAGARSNRNDDELYVVQAEAYAALDSNSAFRRHPDPLLQRDDGAHNRTCAGKQPTLRPPDGLTTTEPDITVFLEDTQLAYTALESQLPSSACAPSDRTSKKATAKEAALGATTHTIDYAFTKAANATPQGKTVRLPAITPNRSAARPVAPSAAPRSGGTLSWPGSARLSQSSYLISPAVARSSKRRRLNGCVQSTSHWLQSNAQPTAQNTLPSVSPAMRRTSSEGAIREEKTASVCGNSSELPTSYSISDEAVESLKRRRPMSQRPPSDPGPQSPSSRNSLRQHGVSQQKTISPIESARMPKPTNDVTATEAAHGSIAAAKVKPTTADSHQLSDLQSLSLVIQPPDVVAGRQFATHVTPTLQRLVDGEVAKCFKPVFEFRAINDLERGHWRMSIPKWPMAQLATFWRTLERLIGGGDAGWGVWCSREPDTILRGNGEVPEASNDMSKPRIDSEPDSRYGTVRVYCWGEVVRHIYLLLYVASNSKVRKLGLQWLDSQGTVVVQMSAKEPSRSR